MKPPSISVVIPAYNEQEHIAPCLHSLAAQKTKRTFEVILVDNGSTDNTARNAQRFAHILDLHILHEPRRCRGQARSTGFAHARGEIILSTDADAIVPENWIAQLTTALTSRKLDAVAGIYEIQDVGPVANVVHNVWIKIWTRACMILWGHYLFRGSNFAIMKKVYIRSGGFSTAADAAEDVELSNRVHRIGRIGYAPNICVRASGRRFNVGFVRGTLQYASVFKRFILGQRTMTFSNVR